MVMVSSVDSRSQGQFVELECLTPRGCKVRSLSLPQLTPYRHTQHPSSPGFRYWSGTFAHTTRYHFAPFSGPFNISFPSTNTKAKGQWSFGVWYSNTRHKSRGDESYQRFVGLDLLCYARTLFAHEKMTQEWRFKLSNQRKPNAHNKIIRYFVDRDFDEDKYRISVILISMQGQNKGFSHISLHYRLFHLKFIIAWLTQTTS